MKLEEFFRENPCVALGFSGGVDSSYLLYAGMKYAEKIQAYYIKTAFQPQFEFEDAKRLAHSLGADLKVIEADILAIPEVTSNPKDRCFYCKTALFGILKAQALKDGYSVIIDGTNFSDDASDRPGMRALKNLSVRSPLRECALTKDEIRRLSREAGLFTWDKPAYACLATRIPTGDKIDMDKLSKAETAEKALFEMGFTDFRVRIFNGCARIQLPESQMGSAVEKRKDILSALSGQFDGVFLDLVGR